MTVAYLTNGRVAWQIPDSRTAAFYLLGIYESPEGWWTLPKHQVIPYGRKWKIGLLLLYLSYLNENQEVSHGKG